MRRVWFMLLSAVMTGVVVDSYAQDVIVTTDARHIDADIREVSGSEVRYKDPTMPDGPVFILTAEEIDSVTFRNGTTRHYNTYVHPEVDVPDGWTYASADGALKLIYDPARQLMYLFARKPVMHNSMNVRNIALTTIRVEDKVFYVVFDMSNKYVGMALTSGSYSFYNNVKFRKYLTKHNPKSFTVDISYETCHITHSVELQER